MKKRMISAVMILAILAALLVGCQKVSSVKNTAASDPIPAVQTGTVFNFSLKEALNAVKQTINVDYTKYKIDLINSNLSYEGQDYYQFQISDDKAAIEPYLIVSKENGAVYCYYSNQTVTEVYQDKVFGSKC